MHFEKAYLKLTLFYVAIVMIISIIFSIVLYGISSRELHGALGRQGRLFKNMPMMGSQPWQLKDFENTRRIQLEESSNNIKLYLLGLNGLILVLSGGISYLMAKRTLRPIEEMVDVQNRFTADASHELRTPLTAMKTEIEVSLRDKNLNVTEARDLLQSNLEEISKLEALSSGLLTLARYQETDRLSMEIFGLQKVIKAASSKIESLAKDKEIDFSIDIPETDIFGNKDSLKEMFVVIFDNAIKYSHPKSKVEVVGEKTLKQVLIKVKDQGVGIKASDIPFIFNRFYRADISRTKGEVSGYGLGLSIAYKIAQAHKGKIEAESKLGQGTTFTIHLPIKS